MNSICKTTLVAVTIFLVAEHASAQTNGAKYEVGVNLGTLVYVGDLSKNYIGNLQSLKPALGLSVTRILNPYFAVSGNFTRGSISADESTISSPAWRQNRNFTFSSSVTELSATLNWNLMGEQNNLNNRRISVFLFGGVGASFINVKRDWSKINTDYFDVKSSTITGLGIDTLQSTPKVIGVLPLGAGIKYAINSQWSVNGTFTYRLTTSDYLDGFKYAANASRRDGYYGISVGVSYQFTKDKYGCPSVR